MRPFRTVGWALLVCLALIACRKSKSGEPPAVIVPATETAAALGVQPEALPDHKTLYDAISKYMSANQGRAAKSVDELVQRGYLKPLPPLPAGKQYYLDQRSATLAIVDN